MASNALTITNKTGLHKAAEIVERVQNKLKKYERHTEVAAGRTLAAGLTVGGGAIVGMLRAKGHGTIPQLGSDTDMVVGTALAAASVFGLAGKHSEAVGHIANGMLAVFAARQIESRLGRK